jgi:acyl-CoA ligase (AMP-forming) (exosortase A-associated)
MTETLTEMLLRTADRRPDHVAISYRGATMTYADLAANAKAFGAGLVDLGLSRRDRVGIYLEKQLETAVAVFGVAQAGCVFVPVNPALKGPQVAYILRDCNVKVLVTSKTRLAGLRDVLGECPDLQEIVLVDGTDGDANGSVAVQGWSGLLERGRQSSARPHRIIDIDMAGILYTSGSTGNPKGVILSHRNVVAGAVSVATYLEYRDDDRILNLPPYSFDFGLNQLMSSVHAGTTAILFNYLLAGDVIKTVVSEKITGLPSVPSSLIQLSKLPWPAEAAAGLRYISTTGGRMPETAVKAFRDALPKTDIFLMYGLTESFRSTYLPPSEIDRRPNSIGKAVPNAEILVVRPDGTPCEPGEPGELVHRGAFVTLGYWNDPKRTAERFKPAPGQPAGIPIPELAVWSGDTVKRDEDGFIYFVGRKDEMIKTSGYRVSPTEVEEVVFASGHVRIAAAVGVEHDELGQAIVVFATPPDGAALDATAITAYCRTQMPTYMVPHKIIEREDMPINPNGKVDRKKLAEEVATLFKEKV